MSKPENSFIAGVHRYVSCYKEKTNNPYRGGTPDVYYEGIQHLWVEYKYIELPKRDTTPVLANLSALQKDWLRRCHLNTGRARVIIGCKEGGVVLETPDQWETLIPFKNFRDNILERKELGAYIDALCLTSQISSLQPVS